MWPGDSRDRGIIGIPADDAALAAPTDRRGVQELLEQLVKRIPAPKGDPDGPLQALIIDSWFDNYVGVVSVGARDEWCIAGGAKIRVMSHRPQSSNRQIGALQPEAGGARVARNRRSGIRHCGIREIDGAPVGDTITLDANPAKAPLEGFKQVQPRVFAGLFPVSQTITSSFGDALKKLKLNDSALHCRT